MIPLHLGNIHLDSAATHRGEMREVPDPARFHAVPLPGFRVILVLPGKEGKTVHY